MYPVFFWVFFVLSQKKQAQSRSNKKADVSKKSGKKIIFLETTYAKV